MANPLGVLPLIDGDTYRFNNETFNENIPAGKRALTDVNTNRGFYFGITSTVSGNGAEDTEMSITVDNFKADTTPRELFESGFMNELGIAPGVVRYDTDNNIFTVVHDPQRVIGYNDTVKFAHRASDDSDGISVDSTIFSIDIIQPRRFVEQYLELTNPAFGQSISKDRILSRFEESV